jgi:hypothetical protein
MPPGLRRAAFVREYKRDRTMVNDAAARHTGDALAPLPGRRAA